MEPARAVEFSPAGILQCRIFEGNLSDLSSVRNF